MYFRSLPSGKFNCSENPVLEFPLAWSLAIVVVFFALSCTVVSHLSFPSFWWEYYGFFIVFVGVKLSYLWLCNRYDFSGKDVFLLLSKRLFLIVEYILVCISAANAMCVLSFLCCTWHYGVVDEALNRLDLALGFDWSSISTWSGYEPQHSVLQGAYNSTLFQHVFLSLWLGFLYEKERLYEFFWIIFSALTITIVISGFLPAIGPGALLGVDDLLYGPDYARGKALVASIRVATDGVINVRELNGIIAFPSFHTVSAIIYMYAFRKGGVVTCVFWGLNLVMLVSIPAFGNHYLVDMLAGAAVAAVSILAVGMVMRRSHKPAAERVSAAIVNA